MNRLVALLAFGGIASWARPDGFFRPLYGPAHADLCTKFMNGMIAGIKIVLTDRDKTMAEMKSASRLRRYRPRHGSDALRRPRMIRRVDPKAIEIGDRMNIAAGFLKPDEKLTDYQPLIDNRYIK
jgi:hypothetical protein